MPVLKTVNEMMLSLPASELAIVRYLRNLVMELSSGFKEVLGDINQLSWNVCVLFCNT